MSQEFNLFPPEDTLLKLRTPANTVIEVDAMDLDILLAEVYTEKQKQSLSLLEVLTTMITKFEAKYGYKMGLRSMDLLIAAKNNKLDEVKKNTYQQSEPC